MADNTQGLPVLTKTGEFVFTKLVDSGGTNVAAVSAAGRLSVDASGVAIPVTDNAGSLTVDAPVATPVFVRLSDGTATLIGQAVMAASLPVVLASNQSAIPVTLTSTTVTGTVTVDSELPSAAALADATANPTVPGVGAFALGYNGTTWDRIRTANTGRLQVDVVTGGGGTTYVGDAAATATPTGFMDMALANAAAPTDVSANNDAVAVWALRNGSQVVNLASGGTLVTVGQKAMTASLPVVLASDQAAIPVTLTSTTITGSVTVDTELPAAAALADAASNPTVPGVGGFLMGYNGASWDRVRTANTGRLQVDVVTGGGGTSYVGDAAATATPTGSMQMALANAAAPTDVSANNDAVSVWALRNGSQVVNLAAGGTLITGDGANGLDVDVTRVGGNVSTIGSVAHDAVGSAVNPLLMGGYAKAAAPTDVSADGDAVQAWHLRNGAQATVLTAAGALIGGDAANGLDVDVTRVPTDPFGANADASSATGSISAKLRFIAGTGIPVTGTVTVDSELPAAAALADATANPTVPGVGGFLMGYNGTTWDRIRIANTGRLQVDVITGGSGTGLTSPQFDYDATLGASLGAGASVDIDFADITTAKTGQLAGLDLWSAAPLKVIIKTVTGGVGTAKDAFGTRPGESKSWRPPHQSFITRAAAGAGNFFRATVTNLGSQASDVHATAFWDEV